MTSQINSTVDRDTWQGLRRECAATAEVYRGFFGCRCGSGARCVWLELAPDVAALVAPLTLTERVLGQLAEPGPVIAHPGESPWCVLLVRAAEDAEQSMVQALSERCVGYLGPGLRVDLPPTRFTDDGPLVWRQTPVLGQEWPLFSTVADVVLNR